MRLPEEEDKEEGKKCLQEGGGGDEDDEEAINKNNIPDGGWGWCVVAAAFFSIMMVDGVCFSLPAIYQPVMENFDASNYQVALMGSMMAGCYLLVGPFVSILCGMYGCRKVTIMGSVVATSGIALSTQVTSIEMMILLYGVVTGIGFGMIYLPSIVSVGYWFSNKRAFTTGIALCGSGVGQFVVPPLTRYLVEEYQWVGANFIIAGFVFKCAVCGMVYFPLDKRRKPRARKRPPVPTRVEIERGAIMKALIEEKKRQRTISNGSLDNCIITRDNRLIKLDPKIFEVKRNNSFIARFKRQLGFSSQSLACSNKSLQGIPSIVIDAVQKDLNNSKLSGASNAPSGGGSPIYKPNGTRVQQLSQSNLNKRSSLPNGAGPIPNGLPNGSVIHSAFNNSAPSGAMPNGAVANGGFPKTRSCDDLPPHGDPWMRRSQEGALDVRGLSLQQVTGGAEGSDTDELPQFLMGGEPVPTVTRSVSDLQSGSMVGPPLDGSVISIQVIQNGTLSSCQSMSRPNSIMSQVPSSQNSYVTSTSIMSFHVREDCGDSDGQMGWERSVCLKFWYIICEMFAFKVLLNPVFAVLVLSTFVTMLGFLVPYIYMPELVNPQDQYGQTSDPAPGMFLISIMGISNTLGRILTGWFADRPWCNTLYLNNVALIVGGIAVVASPLFTSPTALSVLAAFFGLSMAVFNSLRSILLVDLLGLDTLTKSFGLLILFQGIATFLSSPVAGLIMDIMGEPTYSLYLAGSFIVASGLIMFLIRCLPNRMKDEKVRCKAEYFPHCSPITETFKLHSEV